MLDIFDNLSYIDFVSYHDCKAQKLGRSKMNCSMCDNKKALKKTKITRKYKECGLNNITLIGVEHYRCGKCGEEYFSYGNMENLHRTIAHILIQRKGALTGQEVRFLRKYLGYSGTMFSKLIGYDDATLSRLETGAQPVARAFDRLVRFTVASKLPDRDYDLHDKILKGGIAFDRIELTATTHGGWKLKAA